MMEKAIVDNGRITIYRTHRQESHGFKGEGYIDFTNLATA